MIRRSRKPIQVSPSMLSSRARYSAITARLGSFFVTLGGATCSIGDCVMYCRRTSQAKKALSAR